MRLPSQSRAYAAQQFKLDQVMLDRHEVLEFVMFTMMRLIKQAAHNLQIKYRANDV